MRYLINVWTILVKFAINDTKSDVISKFDLSVVAAESRHTLVWPFCLSQKVNMQLKARLKCQVMPQATTNTARAFDWMT